MFRGNDLHTGSSACVHPSMQTDELPQLPSELSPLDKLWKFAVNRVGYVVYHSALAVQRGTSFAVTPPTRFGNNGSLSFRDTRALTYSQEGRHLLGDSQQGTSRLVWESVFNFMNTLSAIGVTTPNLTADSLISSMQFHDSASNLNFPILPSPFDPSRPENETMKQYYKWYFLQHLSVSLGMRKHVYKDYQKNIRDKAATAVVNYSPYELIPVTTASAVISDSDPPNLVSEVLSRIYSGDGQVNAIAFFFWSLPVLMGFV